MGQVGVGLAVGPLTQLHDFPLAGYRDVRLLRVSATTRVYAAVRAGDDRRVVVKVHDLDAREGIEARVEQEFGLLRGLDVEGVVEPLALERAGAMLALVLAWCPGKNLREHAGGRPMAVSAFLDVAIEIGTVLANVHDRRVIHRDIKPTNILITTDSGGRARVTLADFGISVLLEGERQRINHPQVLQGTLPYISPEQTGRTLREVDRRSDLYSLGATFYELLTGRHAFEVSSPLELIHAHLALRPEPPANLRPELPSVLSRVVMKLLEKAPARRYQSARGLVADLTGIRDALAAGRSPEGIALGAADLPTVLQLPHRLYGRNRHVQALTQAFASAASGHPRCLVVTGPEGMGKTALIAQLAGPVLARRGYLARGRFDAETRDQPYAGFAAAFSELADQLLTQSDEQLEHWRRELRRELGSLRSVAAELVPKLRPILEYPPPAPPLGPIESHNRLALVCARMIGLFARPEHPLALALDDVQWADLASYGLIGAILGEPHAALLVVLTMRDEAAEIGDAAERVALANLLDLLEFERRQLARLPLNELSDEEVALLVADTLGAAPETVRPLAEYIGRKTSHNPHFIRQFLIYLFEHELLRPSVDGWIWEPEAIERAGIPEDLLAIMTAKLDRLGEDERELLGTAAVIGARFDLATVGALVSPAVVAAGLLPMTEEGLITPIRGAHYRFTHDRIREAAYRLTTPARRVELHRAIGLRWLERGESDEASLFEIADHLNVGFGLLAGTDEAPDRTWARAEAALADLAADERVALARLNAEVGRRALNASAPRAAVRYFGAGLQLLTEVPLHRRGGAAGVPFPAVDDPMRALRFEVELGRCQGLGLSTGVSSLPAEFDSAVPLAAQAQVTEARFAEAQFVALLAQPLEPDELGQVYANRIEMWIIAGDQARAVGCCVEGLTRLGFEVPALSAADGDPEAVEGLLDELAQMLRDPEIQHLETRERLTDPVLEAALEILTVTLGVSNFSEAATHAGLGLLHVRIIHAHGRHPTAARGLGHAAILVGSGLRERHLAYQVAELSLMLAAEPGRPPQPQRVLIPYWFVASWVKPYASALPLLREAVGLALESGDFEFASYATTMHLTVSLSAGVHLRTIERTAHAAVHRLAQWRAGSFMVAARHYRRFASMLLSGDEAELDAAAITLDIEFPAARYMLGLLRGRLFYLGERWSEALAELETLVDGERVLLGAWHVADYQLFHGLAAAAVAFDRDPDDRERQRLTEVVAEKAAWLRRAAELGPDNCAPRADLLDAELHALAGAVVEGFAQYSVARRSAAAQSLTFLEAIALERLAAFARANGLDDLAAGPLRDARERYQHWGAFAKVAALERRWPGLVRSTAPEPSADATSDGSHGDTAARALDLASILKAAQTIAEVTHLRDVVDRIMAIALENAGAERGVLLLPGVSGLELVAISLAKGAHMAIETPALDREASEGFASEPIPVDAAGELVPVSLLHWVERTLEPAVLDDASRDQRFASDPYIEIMAVRSVLCLPIIKQGRLIALLYLENKLSSGSFTSERLELLTLLMAQAGSALDNAKLFEALRAGEIRWRSLVEGMPDVVMLVDRHGRVEFSNHLERHVPHRRERLPYAGAYIHEEDLPQLREQMRRVIRRGQLVELELRATLFSEQMRWFAVRLAPIVVDGRVSRVICVGTDITERREAQRAKAELEAQVRQQQRLESIGTLASGVAHEINNPIQGIMNYAELIGLSRDASPSIRDFAGEIEHESQRVATIVRNLLAFSRREGERLLDSVRVQAIVEGTMSLIRTVLRKDQIDLQVDIGDGLPTLECRPQQIQQIIMNLVTNARDALCSRWPGFHDDKRITVTARAFRPGVLAPTPGEPARAAPEWIRISVIDRGLGVPPEIANRIFDPFFTTKGRDRGTGLGLSVSHGIASEHGGELRLENHPGEGATFHLELPAVRG